MNERKFHFHGVLHASRAACALLFALPLPQANAGTLTKLDDIGALSSTELVQGNDGNLYSVADGYFYKITPTGTYTAIASWSLQPPNCLIKGSDGDIYGTVPTGGLSGGGVAFKVSLTGTLTILADFGGYYYGDGPGNLVEGANGEFFGTTSSDGNNGYGTIFKLEQGTSWEITTMLSFNTWMGTSPSSLILGSDGALYGACLEGGSYGEGTIYQYWPMDSYPNVLGEFGQYPQWYGAKPAYLIETEPGVFVGMTNEGGYFDRGLLFFYTATSGGINGFIDLGDVDTGYLPNGKPVYGGNGWFYGTMSTGGDTSYSEAGEGTIYRFRFDIDTYIYDYQQMALFNEGTSTGGKPLAPLTTDGSGHFFGTTSSLLNSSIFKFTP